jgi:hypothetical protein
MMPTQLELTVQNASGPLLLFDRRQGGGRLLNLKVRKEQTMPRCRNSRDSSVSQNKAHSNYRVKFKSWN